MTKVYSRNEFSDIKSSDIDLLWKFPGLELTKIKGVKVIHEYTSLSTGSFPKVRNSLKRYLNIKPDGRIFLNEIVERGFKLNQDVPKLYRDMGIAKQFFMTNNEKEYDFVYVGGMEGRGLEKGLEPFTNRLRNHTILMIGIPNDRIFSLFKDYKNIIFTGQLQYFEVPKVASTAEYGYNYIPDIYPFTIQTSTKLLEYCALGLKVVTTNYHWVNSFEKKLNAQFFKVTSNLENLTVENLSKFSFITPDVSHLEWDSIFENIKLLNFIETVMNKEQ